MLTVLFGGTTTGKTTLAKALASRTGLEARFSGDEIREAAKRLGLSLAALPMSEHRRVDEETRAWCAERDFAIVEGRFLDQVLSGLPKAMTIVEVRADPAIRAARCASRMADAQDVADVASYDQEDEAFRVRAYTGQARLTPKFTLDTTALSVDTCIERLIAWRNELKPD